MDSILNVHNPLAVDESVTQLEYYSHQPYGSASYGNDDEVRIAVQNQDLLVLPSKSVLHISGRLTKADGEPSTVTKFVNNGICFLFGEARYEINGHEVDVCKNVGITTCMRVYSSITSNQAHYLENAGCYFEVNATGNQTNAQGYFDVNIPLHMIFGFCSDYSKVVMNCKHELILSRCHNDNDAIISTAAEEFKIHLSKVEWLLPYVRVSDEYKIPLYKSVTLDKTIVMGFRSWELFTYPTLPETSKNIWRIKTTNSIERPRYVIIGFQTARHNKPRANAALFDHCNIRNATLFLNSQSYPYCPMNLDIAKNNFAILYQMYATFQNVYDSKEPEPLNSKEHFLAYTPLICIDCSHQNETLKSSAVDVRLEVESTENFPAETTLYCVIIHDRVIRYSPLTGTVSRDV